MNPALRQSPYIFLNSGRYLTRPGSKSVSGGYLELIEAGAHIDPVQGIPESALNAFEARVHREDVKNFPNLSFPSIDCA
jgi:hypothetical protein